MHVAVAVRQNNAHKRLLSLLSSPWAQGKANYKSLNGINMLQFLPSFYRPLVQLLFFYF